MRQAAFLPVLNPLRHDFFIGGFDMGRNLAKQGQIKVGRVSPLSGQMKVLSDNLDKRIKRLFSQLGVADADNVFNHLDQALVRRRVRSTVRRLT